MKVIKNISVSMLLIISLLTISCSDSSEKKSHIQETTINYDSGELMIKKSVEYNEENSADSIKTITYENFDKTGKCILKYHYEKSENNPVIWDSEKLSNRDSFTDDEEKDFFSEMYVLIGEKDTEYLKNIKFEPGWVLFEDPNRYKAMFPVEPDVSQKDVNFDITVRQATCSHSGYNFTILIFKNSAVSDETAFNEFFNQMNTLDPSMTLEEDKDLEVSGITGKYKKLVMEKGESKVYSRVIQVPYKMHVVSVSVVGFTQYAPDDLFNRFIEGIEFTE